VPVPERATVSVGSEALEPIVRLPFVFAADCGVNSTLKVTLAPGLNVRGRFSPLMLNAACVDVACDTVTLVPPVLVRASVITRLLPIWALPKARALGFAINWPGITAVPDNGKFMVESEALEVKTKLPLAPPADRGAKSTEKETLWPVASVRGTAMPLRVKPPPVIVA